MIITQFITTLGFGGAEAVVRDYALELKKRGHTVTVIVLLPFLHNDNEQKLRDAGITLKSIYEEVFWLKSLSAGIRMIRKPYRSLLVRRWITRYLHTQHPDVLHVHLELLRFIPAGLCSTVGTKLFFTCHNEAMYYFGDAESKEYKALVKHLDFDQMQIFALHSRMKNELNELFQIDTCQVMNNPVQVARFNQPVSDRTQLRLSLGLSDSDFVIGHVGRFVSQKNHTFLIAVFSEYVRVNSNAKLVLVGDGPLMAEIRSQCISRNIIDRVVFTGVRSDIPSILSSFDLFLFPSLFEGLGISFIEAQTKVPYCIASDSVPVDTAVSDRAAYIPLSAPVSTWVDAIQNPQKFIVPAVNRLKDFDIVTVINRLESFYAG